MNKLKSENSRQPIMSDGKRSGNYSGIEVFWDDFIISITLMEGGDCYE